MVRHIEESTLLLISDEKFKFCGFHLSFPILIQVMLHN